jgi:hypothetical protein
VRAKASFQSSCGGEPQTSCHPASGYISRINQLSGVVKVPGGETFYLKPPACTSDRIRPGAICVECLIKRTGNAAIAPEVSGDLPCTNYARHNI